MTNENSGIARRKMLRRSLIVSAIAAVSVNNKALAQQVNPGGSGEVGASGEVKVKRVEAPPAEAPVAGGQWHEVEINLTKAQRAAIAKETGQNVDSLKIRTYDLQRLGQMVTN
ncbi:hypothetical protein [Azospirillum argentinense]